MVHGNVVRVLQVQEYIETLVVKSERCGLDWFDLRSKSEDSINREKEKGGDGKLLMAFTCHECMVSLPDGSKRYDALVSL